MDLAHSFTNSIKLHIYSTAMAQLQLLQSLST